MKVHFNNFLLFSVIFFVSIFLGTAFAHTVDSIDEYRLEIGWLVEPVVSGETNGIELFVSPLVPCPDIEDNTKCAASQKFENGISGLERTLKIQLVYKGEKITLPLTADHNIPGKYFTLVDPTVGGYYQANILGKIQNTTISLSMHPPKVENKTYLQFPTSPDQQILVEHESFRDEINQMQETLDGIESSNQFENISYAAVGLGIAGIVIASIAISKRK